MLIRTGQMEGPLTRKQHEMAISCGDSYKRATVCLAIDPQPCGPILVSQSCARIVCDGSRFIRVRPHGSWKSTNYGGN